MRPGQALLLVAGATATAVLATLVTRRALRDLDAVAVTGRSMRPTLEPGDRLLVEAWTYRWREPRPGEIVLAADPRAPHRELIKRVAAVEAGAVTILGDNPDSTDSRTFGLVPASSVRWRVVFRYWPPRRVGLVGRLTR